MPTALETYYLKQSEPMQGCILAMRDIILCISPHITHERKFQIPFFYYKGKKLAYLWVTKKRLQVGFVEDKCLQAPIPGVRLKDKYQSMQLNPAEDIPIEIILENLNRLIHLYDTQD